VATLAELEAQLAAVNAEIARQKKRDRCREWRAKNSDWVRTYHRNYARANPELNRKSASEHYKKMRETPQGVEHLQNKKRRYKAKNREAINERQRAKECKKSISMKLGVPIKDVPQDMFEATMALNTVTRKIKELSK